MLCTVLSLLQITNTHHGLPNAKLETAMVVPVQELRVRGGHGGWHRRLVKFQLVPPRVWIA